MSPIGPDDPTPPDGTVWAGPTGSTKPMHYWAQKEGVWLFPDGHHAEGYAGGNCGKNPEGINNPDMQAVHNIGPLPCGTYTIQGPPYHNPNTGLNTLNLVPDAANQMFNRGSFRVHGDTATPFCASEGCIVIPPGDRLDVWAACQAGSNKLTVVPTADDFPA